MAEYAEEIYQSLIEKGYSEEDIEKEITSKFNEYQGFMSKQAILFLIAKEKGVAVPDSDTINKEFGYEIDYNEFAIPIAQISEGMSNIVISGRISDVSGLRTFTRKDGTSDIVGSFHLVDNSGRIKAVLWSDHAKLMEHEYFKKGEIIQLIGGYAKKGLNEELEIHLSKKGKLVFSPKDIDMKHVLGIPEKKQFKKSSQLTIKEVYNKEGFVRAISGTVQLEKPKLLTLKNGKKTFLLKFVLSDETSSIKVNVWDMKAIEFIKRVNDDDKLTLFNVIIKVNSYSNEKELSFIKNSRYKVS